MHPSEHISILYFCTFVYTRYAGMVAWRGLVSSKDHPEEVAALKWRYPTWDERVTFELAETPA